MCFIKGILNRNKKNNFGDNLKKLRIKKGLSQQELANQLSVTRQAVSELERNKTLPSLQIVLKLRELYKINLNKFL